MTDRYSWRRGDIEILDPVEKFEDDQPRDEAGRWTYAGGPSSPTKDAGAATAASGFIRGRDKVPVGSGLSYTNPALTALRGQIKHEIATKVGARLESDPRWKGGSGYEEINSMNRSWAQMDTADIQHAAAREFGLGDHAHVRDGASDSPTHGPALRAMYQHTQDELKAAGIERLTLYRGLNGDPAARPAPITSWTSERSIAESGAWMGGGGVTHVVAATFPRDRILSTARTGMGSLPEYEFTVLAGPGEVSVEKYSDDQARDDTGKWTSDGGGGGGSSGSLGASRPGPIEEDEGDTVAIDHIRGNLWDGANDLDDSEISEYLKEGVVTSIGDRMRKDPRWDEARGSMKAPPATDDAVRATLNTWSAASADHDPTAIAIQIAASREFGLGKDGESAMLGRTDKATAKMAMAIHDGTAFGASSTVAGETQRAVLRTMYAETQERFAHDGVKEVTLFRGLAEPERRNAQDDFGGGGYKNPKEAAAWNAMAGRVGKATAIKSNPLSSWAAARATAGNFAGGHDGGLILSATFPVSRILSTARTGMGTFEEDEFVVLGGPGEVMVTEP